MTHDQALQRAIDAGGLARELGLSPERIAALAKLGELWLHIAQQIAARERNGGK